MMARNDAIRDEFPTRPEAARRLGIGLRQIHRACERGDLALYEVGAWPRLRWSEVVSWIQSTRRPEGHPSASVRQPHEMGE